MDFTHPNYRITLRLQISNYEIDTKRHFFSKGGG